MMCNIRSAGTKRIFIVIGAVCVCLVIVLFFMINEISNHESNVLKERQRRSASEQSYGKCEISSCFYISNWKVVRKHISFNWKSTEKIANSQKL